MNGSGLFGMSGEEIYRNFTEAKGGGDLSEAAAMVKQLQGSYQQGAGSVRALAVRMESAWQGDAASAAQRGAVPLAAEQELSAPLLFVAQDLASRQVGSFDSAKSSVVPVPPAPERPGLWEVVTSPSVLPTYEQKTAEHNAASQHNVDVMTGYEGASSYNGDNLPASYGSITPDSAGVGIQQPTTGSGGDDGVDRPGSDSSGGGARSDSGGGPGSGGQPGPASEPAPVAAGSASSGGGPPHGTTPGGLTPASGTPSTGGLPATGGPGSGVPFTGGPGSGGLYPGFGPGPGVIAVPGSGSGSGPGAEPKSGRGGSGGPTGGPGVRGPGETTHGPGGRTGAGPVAGGAAAAEAAAARGGPGRSGMAGGLPVGGAAGRGNSGEDHEYPRPSFLEEDDPEGLFGTDESTAPPVLGLEPPVVGLDE